MCQQPRCCQIVPSVALSQRGLACQEVPKQQYMKPAAGSPRCQRIALWSNYILQMPSILFAGTHSWRRLQETFRNFTASRTPHIPEDQYRDMDRVLSDQKKRPSKEIRWVR